MKLYKAKSWYLEFVRVKHPLWNESTASGIYERFLFALRVGDIKNQHIAAAMSLPKTFARLRAMHKCHDFLGMIGTLGKCALFGRSSLVGYPTGAGLSTNVHIPYLALEHRTLELLHRLFDVERVGIEGADYRAALQAILTCTGFLCDNRSETVRLLEKSPEGQSAMLQAFLHQVVHLCIAALQSAAPIRGNIVSIVASEGYLPRSGWVDGRPAPPRVDAKLRAIIEELLIQLQWIPSSYFADIGDRWSLCYYALHGLERLKQEREAAGESLPLQGVLVPLLSDHETTWEAVLGWLKTVGAANF